MSQLVVLRKIKASTLKSLVRKHGKSTLSKKGKALKKSGLWKKLPKSAKKSLVKRTRKAGGRRVVRRVHRRRHTKKVVVSLAGKSLKALRRLAKSLGIRVTYKGRARKASTLRRLIAAAMKKRSSIKMRVVRRRRVLKRKTTRKSRRVHKRRVHRRKHLKMTKKAIAARRYYRAAKRAGRR